MNMCGLCFVLFLFIMFPHPYQPRGAAYSPVQWCNWSDNSMPWSISATLAKNLIVFKALFRGKKQLLVWSHVCLSYYFEYLKACYSYIHLQESSYWFLAGNFREWSKITSNNHPIPGPIPIHSLRLAPVSRLFWWLISSNSTFWTTSRSESWQRRGADAQSASAARLRNKTTWGPGG